MIVVLLWTLTVGCGGESQKRLFGTAQFEEKQTNFAHAKELYERIIRENPDSEWAKKAKALLEELQKSEARKGTDIGPILTESYAINNFSCDS